MENSSVWFFLIVVSIFECKKIENVTATKEQRTIPEQVNAVEKVFLKRQKRFVIFEKGASMTFQGNIAKAIIAGVPRGLNEIAEYTLTYDLPWKFEAPKSVSSNKPLPLKTKVVENERPNATTWWDYSNDHTHEFVEPKWKTKQKLWCPKETIFENYYDSNGKDLLPLCFDYKSKTVHKIRHKRQESKEGSTLLFDLITNLAEMHGYNARHCIMRTLCEARHLLFPAGRLLFHDLVRILLSHAQPATQRHAPFRAAIHRKNLQECMKLYGLHCRCSFLQHFTESIAAAANSMPI